LKSIRVIGGEKLTLLQKVSEMNFIFFSAKLFSGNSPLFFSASELFSAIFVLNHQHKTLKHKSYQQWEKQ